MIQHSATDAVNRGFSKQSVTYDEADASNPILRDLRKQVYRHVEFFLNPQSRILELNAGTGIDAHYFAGKGHSVLATDLSEGMVARLGHKIAMSGLAPRLRCQQLSYTELDQLSDDNFDMVFSNFGGLNCTPDLRAVAKHLPALLKPGGCVSWVIMPKICPWELMWVLKGKPRQAFRRLGSSGTQAHLEGEYFQTYYHSLGDIRRALGPAFALLRVESLALFSPPPHATQFVMRHRRAFQWLRRIDAAFKDIFPFNRWGDHLIATFRFQGRS